MLDEFVFYEYSEMLVESILFRIIDTGEQRVSTWIGGNRWGAGQTSVSFIYESAMQEYLKNFQNRDAPDSSEVVECRNEKLQHHFGKSVEKFICATVYRILFTNPHN